MTIVDFAAYAPARQAGVDIAVFKHAMRNLAGAVSVITIGVGENRTGFTATSVSSFSAEPPTILVNVDRKSSSWPALREAGSFAVNVLTDGQSAIADRFAGRGGIKGNDRYVGWDWNRLDSGNLGLKSAVAVIDCELEETIERHSHAIVLGRVRSVELTDQQPLLYWRGQYQQLLPTLDPFQS